MQSNTQIDGCDPAGAFAPVRPERCSQAERAQWTWLALALAFAVVVIALFGGR